MKSITLIAALLFFLSSYGQVQTNYKSEKRMSSAGFFQKNYKPASFLVTPPDTSKIKSRELAAKKDNKPTPFQFAEKMPADIDLVRRMNWINDGAFSFGVFSVSAPKAKSLSVQFNKFYLPEGTAIYIYNNQGKMITGPITSAENNKDNVWGNPPLRGDSLYIEIKVPADSKNDLRLNISSIAYGYKDIFSVFTGTVGGSGACEINVLCSLGNNFTDQRLAIAEIVGNQGTELFTGEMIMNACNLNIPNILTAWHVLDTYINTWQFVFKFWSPTCTPTQTPTGSITFNGGSLIASNMASDFALVQLIKTPASTSNITFLGWNRSAVAATSTVGIHHPRGDVMKISADANAPVLADYNAPPLNSTASNWWSAHFQQGTVEPGSSGSALFDQNGRVVGQLSGNPNTLENYCTEQIGEYGRFDLSWNIGGTAATELRDWLDPGNTGVMTTNTTNISALTNIANMTITGPTSFCSSGSYSVNTTLPVTWTAVPSGSVSISSPNSASTNISLLHNGLITLTATATAGCGSVGSVSVTVAVGKPDNAHLSIVSQGPNVCPNVPVSFGARYNGSCTDIHTDGITDFVWTVSPTPNTIINNSGMAGCGLLNNSSVRIRFPNQTLYNVTITAQNACGISSPSAAYIVHSSSSYCGGFMFSVYPNPSTGSVSISLQDQGIESAAGIDEIKVYDSQGNLRQRTQYNKSGNAVINCSFLPVGVYVIEIRNGDLKERHQFILKR